MLRFALWLLLLALTGPAYAQMWVDQATISPTTSLSAGHLCYTDGRDIACDASAPTLSGLGSSDRIVSGTTSMVANSATSIISITTSGVTTGYFNSAGLLVVPGISITQNYGISSTTGYFSGNVGIGTNAPSLPLTVSGTGIRVEGILYPRYSWNYTGGSTNEKRWQAYAAPSALNFSALNDAENAETMWMVVNRGVGTSITSVAFPNGNIGVGTLAPSMTLTVSGTVYSPYYAFQPFTGLAAPVSQSGTGGGGSLTGSGTNTQVAYWNSSTGLTSDAGMTWHGTTLNATTFQVAQSNTACNSSNVGMIRRNSSTNKLQVCLDH